MVVHPFRPKKLHIESHQRSLEALGSRVRHIRKYSSDRVCWDETLANDDLIGATQST